MTLGNCDRVKVRAAVVAGGEPAAIAGSALMMMERKKSWSNPFAGGHAAERILKVTYCKLS